MPWSLKLISRSFNDSTSQRPCPDLLAFPFGEVPRILGQGELGPFASTCSPQTASFCLHRSSEHPGAVSIVGLRLASCSSRSLELRIAGLVGREKARRAAS